MARVNPFDVNRKPSEKLILQPLEHINDIAEDENDPLATLIALEDELLGGHDARPVLEMWSIMVD